jgi:hypothetical protein
MTSVLLWVGALIGQPLEAQLSTRLGARVGAGIDGTGRMVYVGQIDFTDFGEAHSVELAVVAMGARLDQAFTAGGGGGVGGSAHFEYEELTRAEGIGLIGSLLIGHVPGRGRPYLLAGIGPAVLSVDWRLASSTDHKLGTPRLAGGSFREEHVRKLGSVAQLGVGVRVRDRFDLRAQGQALVVPSTDAREDMKVLHTITLSTGIQLP